MRLVSILFMLSLCLILVRCTTRKVRADIDNVIEYLEKHANNEHQLKEVRDVETEYARGYKLYKAYCSECHGIFSKGKEGIPDFSSRSILKIGIS